jgi:low temperature requirement protein LtrA
MEVRAVVESARTQLMRDPENTQRSTFLELFFDLVFAFALTRLADGLINDLGWDDALETAILLPALWWVWTLTVFMNDWLEPDRLPVQAAVVGVMLGSLVLSAAVPEAFDGSGLLFGGVYVAVQVGRTVFFTWALRGHHLQARGWRVLFWFGLSGVLWILGGVAGYDARIVLWAAAVVIDYVSAVANYPTPGLGRNRTEDWRLAGEHLTERYRQFVIIALGETILVTGSTLSRHLTGLLTAAAVAAFFKSVFLWRIYFHRVAEFAPAASAFAHPPARLARLAAYQHLPIIAGVVVSAVGDRLALLHPYSPAKPAWIAMIAGGPVLFIGGRAIFEYTLTGRTTWTRPAGLVALTAAGVAMTVLNTLGATVLLDLVLLAIVIADAAVHWRQHPGEAHPQLEPN